MEERRRGPAEMPNFGPPSMPRLAASIVLLRRGGKHSQRPMEVLMLRRSEEAKFMPGVWVFPGGSLDEADGAEEAGLRACAVRELAEEAGIELPAGEELVPFTRWITPEVIATRFDAWFFLALAPAHTPPKPDGVETTEARWFEPAAALAAQEAGELLLSFPTQTQLRWLAEHSTSDEVLAAYRARTLEPILPVVIAEDGAEPRVVLPGDPGYPA
ncbi:MAG TPA: NUDIX hydrolase [Solirubrobacterales bacterium]|nr:NUDIX hydrolase [Solirubrobacterales bacterium]